MHNPTFSSYFCLSHPLFCSEKTSLCSGKTLLCSEKTLLCSEKTLLCSEKTTLCSSKKNMYENMYEKMFFLIKYLVLRCENLWYIKMSFPEKMKKWVKHFLPCVNFPAGAFFYKKNVKTYFAVCAFSRRGLFWRKKRFL